MILRVITTKQLMYQLNIVIMSELSKSNYEEYANMAREELAEQLLVLTRRIDWSLDLLSESNRIREDENYRRLHIVQNLINGELNI